MDTGLRPRQLRRVETRLQQRLRSADALQGAHDMQCERHEPGVVGVRQGVLRLGPNELIGIELRRVDRKPMNLQAWVSAQDALDVMPSMDLPAIPQEHDWPAEVTQQLPEKGDDLGASDVAGMEIKVQPEPVATGRHGERRNDRDLVTAVAVPKLRRTTDGGPGLADIRDEQESTFIEERQMGAPARGVFLSGATRPASTAQSPLH